MSFEPMKIDGAWVYRPMVLDDNRGSFHETFRLSDVSEILGDEFMVKQINQSVSKRNVIRGIHFAATPPGQAKYVTCPQGSILDIVVDIRVGSPSFGLWDAIEISEYNKKAVLISEGLGHAFIVLNETATVNYLCDEYYNPEIEYTINLFDDHLAINFKDFLTDTSNGNFIVSERDSLAKPLSYFLDQGLLPRY